MLLHCQRDAGRGYEGAPSCPTNPIATVATMGIDIGKNSFHVVGLDQRGAIVLRQKWSRGQIEARLAQHAGVPDRHGGLRWRASPEPQAAIARSRCATDAGEIRAPVFERTEERLPRRGSDRRGGAAADDAIRRHQDDRPARLQALHRVRERLVSQRTGIINQIRAFLLERGIAVRQGLRFLRRELPSILATRSDVLSPRMMRIIADLAGDWHRLDERIDGLSTEIEALAHQDAGCARLMTVPGIGPIVSSAMVAAIGSGSVFSKGRDFGAWLGLVPRQISTGDRTILGKISKRGNRYLRVLFVQAARVVLIRPKSWERHGLKSWIEAASGGCTRMCWPSRSPTSSPVSPGRFSTRNATSNAPRTSAMTPQPA